MADIYTTTAGEPAFPPPPLPGHGADGGSRSRRRRWPVVLVAFLVLLGAAAIVLDHVSVNDYGITPGDATPVGQFINVPKHLDHPIKGNILLTDVYVTQLNALTYLQERYLSSDADVISSNELLGPSTPANEYIDQGYLEMMQAQQAATAAALSHLGFTINAKPVGALLYGIDPGSPASHSLQVAQIVIGINYTLTPTACSLVTALHGLQPGTSPLFKIEESTISNSGVFESGKIVERRVLLGTPPKGLEEVGCGAADTHPTAYLGIEPETQFDWNFPVNVQVHTADIGGPSAGLAMTLGIIDKLSGGHLTGNRIIAATGTIDPQGDVGDVGGVAEKTIAVERAGATVFFVPPQELAAARSKDTPQLHIYAVSSLDQALRILKRLGGKVPTSHSVAQAAP
jgi:PDZ domain-containing protein